MHDLRTMILSQRLLGINMRVIYGRKNSQYGRLGVVEKLGDRRFYVKWDVKDKASTSYSHTHFNDGTQIAAEATATHFIYPLYTNKGDCIYNETKHLRSSTINQEETDMVKGDYDSDCSCTCTCTTCAPKNDKASCEDKPVNPDKFWIVARFDSDYTTAKFHDEEKAAEHARKSAQESSEKEKFYLLEVTDSFQRKEVPVTRKNLRKPKPVKTAKVKKGRKAIKVKL